MKPFVRGVVDLEQRRRKSVEIVRHHMKDHRLEGLDENALVEKLMADSAQDEIWINDRYQVNVRHVRCEGFPDLTHLSIKRRDKSVIRDWRELQAVKNAILGPEIEAVELFPAESRLVDTANQYHLWALPKGLQWPFGFQDRLVDGTDGVGGSRQRHLDTENRASG